MTASARGHTGHHPEIMRKVWIVNAPWAFAAAWNLVAPLLPEQTRKKVCIMGKGSAFLPQLLEEIDSSELPELLGGSRTAPNGVPAAEKVPATLGEALRAAAPPAEIS